MSVSLGKYKQTQNTPRNNYAQTQQNDSLKKTEYEGSKGSAKKKTVEVGKKVDQASITPGRNLFVALIPLRKETTSI